MCGYTGGMLAVGAEPEAAKPKGIRGTRATPSSGLDTHRRRDQHTPPPEDTMTSTSTQTPTLDHVDLTPYTDEYGSGVHVSLIWRGVDRPNTGGWAVKDMAMANRLARAIRAGAAITDPQVLTDVNGATYVGYQRHVMGRRMNADLRRLGY